MSITRPVRSRCAFTYVELLVLIGIVALIIAILLPTIHRLRMTSFESNPFVGIQRDNIFTTKLASTGFTGGPILAPPYDQGDSILLPTSN